MNNRVSPLRVIFLTILTFLIIAAIFVAFIYVRDSMIMREGDINYNSGNYSAALARYRVLENTFPFQQEASEKVDYCNYNLALEAVENKEWEEAKGYLAEVKNFEPDSVAILMEESEKGLTAPVEVEAPPVEEKEEERKTIDQEFLEDLEKAITLRLDPDDDGDIVSRELMFLGRYEDETFGDEALHGCVVRYLNALREQWNARYERYECEKQVEALDGELQVYEVLNELYENYGFMRGNVQFVGEYIGEREAVEAKNAMIRDIYNDMHSQVDPVATWPTEYNSTTRFYHIYRNNTAYTFSVTFIYYIYTANYQQYLGTETLTIDDIPPYSDYKVYMVETDNAAGVSFYVDWVIN